jgi:hypothetical protein
LTPAAISIRAGFTLYEMLTGVLPFTASYPMESIHCHIARPPPSERMCGIPGAVEVIVLKLLAKSVEDRYQTAASIEADLQRCLTAWDAQRCIAGRASAGRQTQPHCGQARQSSNCVASAQTYLAAGRALPAEDGWERCHARALSAGAICFLSKPAAKEDLLTCIRSALNRPHGQSRAAGNRGDDDASER